MQPYPDSCTAGELYDQIFATQTPEQAAEHLAALIERQVRMTGCSEDEARQIHLSNIGYIAGYGDAESFARVMKLYGSSHPVFGTEYPSPRAAFDAGRAEVDHEAESNNAR